MAGTGAKQEAGASRHDPDAATQLSSPPANAVDPLASDTLVGGDYRIAGVVERDETTISYKAEDVNLGVFVLLKEFAPASYVTRQDDGQLARSAAEPVEAYESARAHFLLEAQTLVRFRHPSIVRAHRVFETNATKYIVLDYEQGAPFDTWLSDLGRAPSQSELDRIVAPLLGALASVHAAGYLHTDIRPGSILMRSGAPPVLVNFAGACEMTGPRIAAAASPDAAFTAPELLAGDAPRCGRWTDIYALAAVLYLAVTGTPPKKDDGPSAEDGARSDYRADFLQAIDHGLAAKIDARPQSIEDWDGIRAPDEPDAEPAAETAAAPAARRQATSSSTAPATGGTAAKTALAEIATRVVSALPEAAEETDIPKYDFERWLLPAALAAALAGALLFSTGMNFALAAVFQVAATGLFFLRGYLPLSRYLSHTTRQSEAIVRRAEQVTRNAAWMIAAILAVMTVNPLFVEWHITVNTDVPLTVLSAIIAIPALMMAACGFLGMPVRWSLSSLAAGSANVFVAVFNVLFFSAFVFTLASTAENAVIHPSVQVNRYLYVIATVAAAVLGVLIFISRLAARQRIKQAAVSR